MRSPKVRVQLTTPQMLRFTSHSQLARGVSRKGPGWATPPALFTSTSTSPKVSSVARRRCSTEAWSVTSVGTTTTRPGNSLAASATRWPCAASRVATTTLLPSSAKQSTSPRPIPPLPPVTITVLPASPRSMRASSVPGAMATSPRGRRASGEYKSSTRPGGSMRRAVACLALALLSAPAPARSAGPQVELFSPQGTVKEVRQVRVRFSAPMVAFGDPRLREPFAIACPEKGTGRWADARNWVYDFERDLPAGVACRFSLRAGVADLEGAPLAGPREFRFDTGGPAIRQSLPFDGHPAIDENQVFVLALDGPADAASVAAHARCAVAGLGEAIEVDLLSGAERAAVLAERRHLGYAYFQILWKGGVETLERATDDALVRAETELVLLRCRRTLPASAEVKLFWGAGIRSPSGIATAQDQVLAFRTRPEFDARFECRRVRPDAACLPLGPMALRFSAPVPRERPGRLPLLDAGGREWPADAGEAPVSEEVTFAGPFPESARFRVEVPEGMRDDAGRPLANAGRFPLEVATDELPPLAKFSGEFGILEAREGGILPVTLRNLDPEVAAKSLRVGAPALEPSGIPGVARRFTQDDAEIARWIERVEEAMRRRGERVREGDTWVWKERTGSTSVFEGLPAGSGETRSFTVPKPGGAREFEVVGIPLGDPGFYVVELASPRLGAALLGEDRPRYVATAALVTNLAVHLVDRKSVV